MALQPILIVQVPRGGAVNRQLEAHALPSMESGRVVVQAGPTDAEGNLEASAAGQVVLSLPSPEALEQEAGIQYGNFIFPLIVDDLPFAEVTGIAERFRKLDCRTAPGGALDDLLLGFFRDNIREIRRLRPRAV